MKGYFSTLEQHFVQTQAAIDMLDEPEVSDIVIIRDKEYVCKEWIWDECILEEVRKNG